MPLYRVRHNGVSNHDPMDSTVRWKWATGRRAVAKRSTFQDRRPGIAQK